MRLSRYHEARRGGIAAIVVLAFAATLFVRSDWVDPNIHEFIEACGVFLIALGILGRMWCVLYIGARKSKVLVTEGPYSMTRNPLYVFSTIAAAGVGAQAGSLTVGLVFMLLCGMIFRMVIAAEEDYLSHVIGPAYAVYLRSVPRFVPDLRLFRDEAELSVTTRLVYRTFFDGLIFFVSVPVMESIERLQSLHVLPVLLHLP